MVKTSEVEVQNPEQGFRMAAPLPPSGGACSEGQRCPLRSCHLQSDCLGDGTVGTKPDSEDDWK